MTPGKIPSSLADLLRSLEQRGGDALHLSEGTAPVLEIKRQLLTLEGPPLKPGDTYAWLAMHAAEEDIAGFHRNGLACFYHRGQESTVWQFMAFKENGHVRLELRKFQ